MKFSATYWVLFLIGLFFLIGVYPETGMALDPEGVLVVANRNARGSMEVAGYYMKRRGIPKENILPLWVSDRENCSRSEYDRKVAAPVRKYLANRKQPWRIRCLAVILGMPLKVAAPEASDPTGIDSEKRFPVETGKSDGSGGSPERPAPGDGDASASLDSELMVVLYDEFRPEGWLPNPYFIANQKDQKHSEAKNKLLMVSRIDGPSVDAAKRIIDDSLFAEEQGLAGVAYFDARWPFSENTKMSGYGLYDHSIHLAARHLKSDGGMGVFVNDAETLFSTGDCPDAALYCGWYSLTKYVDAFTWRRGAVGYHIASGECATLKRDGFQGWCKKMLEKGVAATLGPVSEPYVQAFPLPDIFFKFLTEGYLSLVECYAVSLPFVSWKMVLIGDPLYQPFQRKVM